VNLEKNGVMIMSIQSEIVASDVMLRGNKIPKVYPKALLKDVLEIMDGHSLGIVCIVDQEDKLEGIITDGDIRRLLSLVQKPFAALLNDDAVNHCVTSPLSVDPNTLLTEVVAQMGKKKIWDLPVVSEGVLIGLVHLHPAIEAVMNKQKL